MDSVSIIYIIAIVLLLLLSAFFSATETAFSSLNRIRVKNMAENGSKRAALVMKLYGNYDRLLSTILVGNNIVNITAATIGTLLFVKEIGNIGATISTIVITVAVLIFGEISPKSLAKESPEKFAMFSAPVLRVLVILFVPVNGLFFLWKKLLSKVFKTKDDKSITEQELLTIIEEAEQGGAINEEDKQLIHNVIDFDDCKANDIMTPRVDIASVSRDAPLDEISDVFMETGYSRIPVYDGTIDNIVGVIHIRDFFELRIKDKAIGDIISPTVFVAPTAKINDLLKTLQSEKCHLAVVTDEYGGTAGIVTMEDILEELVGEIWDEHDEITEEITDLGDGSYKIACGTEISKMLELFSLDGDAESLTVGGWVMEQLGTIPKEGDTFDYKDLSVKITKTDHRRAVEIVVTKHNEPADKNDGDETAAE